MASAAPALGFAGCKWQSGDPTNPARDLPCPNEKIFNGIGFTISVDVLRNLIKEEKADKKKILLMFKDSYLLEKGMNEQKAQQKKGNIVSLFLH